MSRFRAFVILGLHFARHLLASGFTTAWIIVRPGLRTSPGLVWVPFGNLSPTGAALLASLITLTPGTTAIDIEMEKRRLLLHLLDCRDPGRTAALIRREFERYLEILFPGGAR